MVVPNRDPTSSPSSDESADDIGSECNDGRIALDAATKNQLLSLVMSETLARRRDDPAELLRLLRSWRCEVVNNEFDQSTCEGMVGQVLRHRLGPESDKIPSQLREELGEVLWNDPDSQFRLRRIWVALGTTT
jgi:hypothetical protein